MEENLYYVKGDTPVDAHRMPPVSMGAAYSQKGAEEKNADMPAEGSGAAGK